ncbi:hypothetical protein ACMWP3_17720, partial [Escherichia coli]|uniref:hypothetical protein n=1 Tax=Escherichia coli TaxID=562 RepID=UPI0039E0215F
STSKTPSYTKSVSWHHHQINNELAGASTGNILISGRFMLNRPVLSINYRLTYFASIKLTPQPQS